jgi:hypothetical protein
VTNSTSASLSFASTEGSSTFQCSLDGAAFGTCTSPSGYSGLAAGDHTFEVRATDAAGNQDTSPASRGWTIDVTAPTSALTAPANGATLTGNSILSATASDNLAVATVDFLVDGSVVATDTTSPYSVTWNSASLADGQHSLTARATDTAGNVTTSASRTINTENAAPTVTIDAGPADPSSSSSALFSFHSSEAVSTFACKIDNGPFKNCSSPKNYGGLSDGSHTFQVRATDAANNTGAATTFTWTIDTVAPTVASNSPASGATNIPATTSVTATFSEAMNASTITTSTFTLARNGFAGNVSATVTYNATTRVATLQPSSSLVASASYTATIVGGSSGARDLAGNALASNRVWSFTVAGGGGGGDTTAPTASITSPTNGSTVTGNVQITATASDNVAVARVELYVDGVLFATDTSAPYNFNWNTKKVSRTTHTLQVRAYDAAGNVGSSATVTVTVQ